VSRLPILAAPLLADGGLLVIDKIKERRQQARTDDGPADEEGRVLA
jgi:hypothetical protein